jgi:thiol-disulfide isomerase/thioredoxin
MMSLPTPSSSSSKLATLLSRVVSPLLPSSTTSSASVLALYFASSWCPDCQASAPHVSAIFRSQGSDASKQLFDLVYVSSDRTASQLEGNVEEGWCVIPFDNEEGLSDLKVYFGVCARAEMDSLAITTDQRRGGIPTLILIEKATNNVISTDAIPDILGETKVLDPLSYWKSLLSTST